MELLPAAMVRPSEMLAPPELPSRVMSRSALSPAPLPVTGSVFGLDLGWVKPSIPGFHLRLRGYRGRRVFPDAIRPLRPHLFKLQPVRGRHVPHRLHERQLRPV